MRKFIGMLLIVLATSPAGASDISPLSLQEREALVALYNSTAGEKWKNQEGWLGAPGTECEWHGVTCGFAEDSYPPRWSVWALDLDDNGLVGHLPETMNALGSLELLFIRGNDLTGDLPTEIRQRWLNGPLRLLGYSGQFNAKVSEIIFRQRSVALCGDMQARIRPSGEVETRTEVCRESPDDEIPTVVCEIKSGYTNVFAQDVDKLVVYLEESGFFDLKQEYWRNMTHGGTTEVEVVRDGRRWKVTDFGAYGPYKLWIAERLIEGVLAESVFESTVEQSECGFRVRDK
jgi:hypothetical protein